MCCYTFLLSKKIETVGGGLAIWSSGRFPCGTVNPWADCEMSNSNVILKIVLYRFIGLDWLAASIKALIHQVSFIEARQLYPARFGFADKFRRLMISHLGVCWKGSVIYCHFLHERISFEEIPAMISEHHAAHFGRSAPVGVFSFKGGVVASWAHKQCNKLQQAGLDGPAKLVLD